jgi:hypothetical protein
MTGTTNIENEIFETIRGELRYQDAMTRQDSHVREGLTTGELILAMDKILKDAKDAWYSERPPHTQTRHLLRKVAALCVRVGIDNGGLPKRDQQG